MARPYFQAIAPTAQPRGAAPMARPTAPLFRPGTAPVAFVEAEELTTAPSRRSAPPAIRTAEPTPPAQVSAQIPATLSPRPEAAPSGLDRLVAASFALKDVLGLDRAAPQRPATGMTDTPE